MQVQETVFLTRDCIAVMVPSGQQVVMQEGAEVGIVQSLGGSFTVMSSGRMYRIDGTEADALGKEPLPRPELADDGDDGEVEQLIWEQLKTCYDPEIPINIVDLGLVYTCNVERMSAQQRRVGIEMTLTAPGCGMGDVLASDVRQKVLLVPTVAEVDVEVVFYPPWNYSMMSEDARLQAGVF